MRMNRALTALPCLVLMAFFVACSEDENPVQTEQFGEVSGTVTFVGTWPSIGDVQVSMWTSWPPAGPPAAASAKFASGMAKQTYKIEGLNKGTYQVVTVGWRDPANPAAAKVLGIYWARNDSLAVDGTGRQLQGVQPIAIEISDAKLKWTNVDIKANLDIAR